MSLLSRLVDQNNEFSRAPIRLDESARGFEASRRQ